MTAGATVLGIAAMSGVSHAETSQPSAKQPALSFKSAAPKKEPPKKASKTTKNTKTLKKAKTRKGAAATPKPGLSLRLAPTLKYDEPSKTVGVGLDLGVGLGSPDDGVNVRVKAGVNASLGGGSRQGNRTTASQGPGLSVSAGLGVSAGGRQVVGADAEVGASVSPLSANVSANACIGGCQAPTPPTPPTPPVPPTPPTPPVPPGPTEPGPPSGPLLPDLPSSPMGPGATAVGDFTPPKELPFTGMGALPLVALGITAIAAGGAAVTATRRRTVRES